jgi:phage repressor protein C with HTH and peptisase S24 domain
VADCLAALHIPGMAKGKKKTGLGKRITSAREQAGLSQTALGEAFGLTRSSVSQWESETTEPSAANLRAIALRCRVDYDWLATGRGSQDFEDEPYVSEGDTFGQTAAIPGGIREIDVRAGLGGGGEISPHQALKLGETLTPVKDEAWRFPSRFMREEIKAPESRIIILETQGDSMAPTILSGDRVIVDTGHTLPSPDGIYAVRDQYGSIVVKRLQVLRRGDPPQIRIISDNKSHDPEDVGIDEIAIVGRVLWGLKRL